jgi:hypothetical protein
MRFTIRDTLWLMVVVGLVILLWLNALSIDRERAAMQKEAAAQAQSLRNEELALREKITIIDNYSLKLERELDALKRKSAELGIPSPQTPLTLDERPN